MSVISRSEVIEREAEYVDLARNRIHGDAPLLNREAS